MLLCSHVMVLAGRFSPRTCVGVWACGGLSCPRPTPMLNEQHTITARRSQPSGSPLCRMAVCPRLPRQSAVFNLQPATYLQPAIWWHHCLPPLSSKRLLSSSSTAIQTRTRLEPSTLPRDLYLCSHKGMIPAANGSRRKLTSKQSMICAMARDGSSQRGPPVPNTTQDLS
jgi:hypothetical protein